MRTIKKCYDCFRVFWEEDSGHQSEINQLIFRLYQFQFLIGVI